MIRLMNEVIETAVDVARRQAVPIHTFAFYHDHESAAISVCLDTEANCRKVVNKINKYNMKRFQQHVEAESVDIQAAALWQANVGRNLSLGDFALVNVARADLNGVVADTHFYAAMVQTVVAHQPAIVALAPDPSSLLFCCSGPRDEVELVWSILGVG